MRNLAILLPQEYVVLLFLAAGLAFIVGARRFATGILLTAIAALVLPAVLAPLFDTLPSWLLLALIVFLSLSLARVLFELLIGRRATEHMVGILAADVVRAIVLAPFRLLGWILRTLWRSWRRRPRGMEQHGP